MLTAEQFEHSPQNSKSIRKGVRYWIYFESTIYFNLFVGKINFNVFQKPNPLSVSIYLFWEKSLGKTNDTCSEKLLMTSLCRYFYVLGTFELKFYILYPHRTSMQCVCRIILANNTGFVSNMRSHRRTFMRQEYPHLTSMMVFFVG